MNPLDGHAAMWSSGAVDSFAVRRIVVLGVSGAGKSTVARELARLVDGPHVELDAVQHGPGWSTPPAEEIRAWLAEATGGPAWVVDGNLASITADVLWHRADLIVWLDLPLWVALPRLVRRTTSRVVRRTVLWNGNRERASFLVGPDSVLVWAVKARRRHRADYPGRLARAGVPWVRLRSSAAVARWLAGFSAVSRRRPGTGRRGPASR
ncbi:adenylate kinase [Actinosynnema sp. NPDC053489]|uniref:adenylate kinase n=1 Tax=Actinosynnema sp. NPDC053489 TaxID=3363916 RepID=UPI0037C82B56